jgi:hypothetical protein
MCEVMLDRHDLRLLQVEAKLQEAPLDTLTVAMEAPVAGQDRVQSAVGSIPVAFRIVPARRFRKADRGKGDGHRVYVLRPDAGKLQAELRGLVGHTVLGVLVANETLLLCRCDELAVDIERCRRIVGQCAGQAE